MSDKREFKPLPRNLLDFGKLALFGEKLEGGDRRPQFMIKQVRGFAQFMVRTGLPTDVKNGFMFLKVDPKNFYKFLVMFKKVLDGEISSFRQTMYDKSYNEKEKKYSDELEPTGSVKVAKDNKDLYYISVVIDKRPKIQFYFTKSFNCSIKKEEGVELTQAEESKLEAEAYYELIKDLFSQVLSLGTKQIFESPFKDEPTPQMSTPSTQSFDDFEDDVPF